MARLLPLIFEDQTPIKEIQLYRLQLYVPGFDSEEPLGTTYDTFEEAEAALTALKQALKLMGAGSSRFDYEIVS